jgi:uncharacterized protein
MLNTETPSPSPSSQHTWKWVDLIFILLGMAGFLFLGVFLFGGLFSLTGAGIEDLLEPTIAQSLGLAALEAIALVGGVYLLGMRRKKISWRELGFRSLSRRWLLVTLLISAIAIPLSGLVAVLIMQLLGLPMENPQLEFLAPEGFTWTGLIGMILLGGLAVPFAEELFFRGVLYNFLRERWGVWPGVLISSLIFGAVHGHIAVAGTAFVLGIILGLIYEYSRSMWAPVFVHAINNSAKIVLLYVLIAFGYSLGI